MVYIFHGAHKGSGVLGWIGFNRWGKDGVKGGRGVGEGVIVPKWRATIRSA